ncbi:MAG: hypothetical protein HC895_16540 [Leptolyngbyaceae cyanobacterium SM1_3_5]|nr:hypothetical protein [Leptolyngbyaceae cyanobacterium SM1_3_5]
MFSEVKRLLVVVNELPAVILTELQAALPQAEITCLPFAKVEFPGGFDGAIVLTAPMQSPYPAAYRCYLAGIPIRVGQSIEFGGGVLSHCIEPIETDDLITHHCIYSKKFHWPIASALNLPPLQSPPFMGDLGGCNRSKKPSLSNSRWQNFGFSPGTFTAAISTI